MYDKFLAGAKIRQGMIQRLYLEQEVKTMWQQIYVPLRQWRFYGCALPVAHKKMESRFDWFAAKCNFTTRELLDREWCDADPEMRIC